MRLEGQVRRRVLQALVVGAILGTAAAMLLLGVFTLLRLAMEAR